jgi:hypothetical protein
VWTGSPGSLTDDRSGTDTKNSEQSAAATILPVVTLGDTTQTTPARLRVRVTPGARRSEVVGKLGDTWKVRVHAAPERGRANAAVVELLAVTLGVPRGELRVVAGHATRDKVVELVQMPLEEAERLLVSAEADER